MPPTIASGSGRAHHSNCVFSRNISSEPRRKPPLLRPCTGEVSDANTRETGVPRVRLLEVTGLSDLFDLYDELEVAVKSYVLAPVA